MSDLPFGFNSNALAPSEIKTIDPTKVQTARAIKKTPYQKHKEEQEKKKKVCMVMDGKTLGWTLKLSFYS
jgi:hypothetical protein